MDVLRYYYDFDELDELADAYGEDKVKKLDNDNVYRIILYLEGNKLKYWKDIMNNYFDLFLLNSDDFINRFEKLKQKYPNYDEIIGYNIEIIEEMYH